MTTHPPEPPAPWPSSPEERPASQTQRPGPPDEWRAFQRHAGDQPVNGRRAAASARGAPLADYPPETGHEPPPGQPPGAGYGPDDDPDYPAAPGYPDLPDYPRDGYQPAGYPPTPDYLAADYPPMPDYPPTPDYPRAPGYPPTPDYLHPPGRRAAPGSPDAAYLPGGSPPAGYAQGGHPASGSQVAEFPAADGGWGLEGVPVAHEEYVHPGDGPAQALAPAADAAPATGPEGAQWAMLAYLTVPFFGFLVPLAIYLPAMRRSRWLRAHAAQAVNVWLTGILYDLCALIIGAVLILDSPRVALAVVVPLVIVLWLTNLVFLVRAAARASRGETYAFPRWLCTPMVR
jgi:uncharacterized Tic20 family protein